MFDANDSDRENDFRRQARETVDRRVRPEELATALSVIEHRRRNVLTGTLSLHDSLSQLQVDVTSDEVWQEIELLRATKSNRKGKQGKSQGERLLYFGVAFVALCVTALGIRWLISQTDDFRRSLTDESAKGTPIPAPPANKSAPPTYAYLFPNFFYRSPTMRSLTSIKDGEPIALDFSRIRDLSRMLHGDHSFKPMPPSVMKEMYFDQTPYPGAFTIVRLDGTFYLRAWTTEEGERILRDSPKNKSALAAERFVKVSLFNRPQDHTLVNQKVPPPPAPFGASPKEIAQKYTLKVVQVEGGAAKRQVQFPIDGFDEYYSGVGDAKGYRIEVGVDAGKIDRHTFENWTPIDFQTDPRLMTVPPGREIYIPPQ